MRSHYARGENIAKQRDALRLEESESILKTLSSHLGDDWKKKASGEHFTKKLFAAIEYNIKRHDWYEEQRARILQSSLTLMAGILTVLGFVVRVGSSGSMALERLWPLCALGLITITAVLVIVYDYNLHLDADRPYRLLADITYWFFRYNLPGEGSTVDPENWGPGTVDLIAKERRTFVTRGLAGVEWSESVREDLEQIFILQQLQRDKHESLKQMRLTLSYFAICAAIAVGLYLAFTLYATTLP